MAHLMAICTAADGDAALDIRLALTEVMRFQVSAIDPMWRLFPKRGNWNLHVMHTTPIRLIWPLRLFRPQTI